MTQQFTELFSIDCRHSYFADGVARPVVLVPTDDCVDLLRRYRLLMRRRSGGCTVYYDRDDSLALLARFDESAPFNFMLTSSDPYLFNYTEWPFAAGGVAASISPFDNRQDFPDGLLHPPGAPSSAAALPVQTGPFTQPLVQAVQSANVALRGGLGWPTVWQTRTSAQMQSGVMVDTSGLASGQYQLWVMDEKQSEFCLCNGLSAACWGLVSIYAGGSAQAAQLPAGRFPIGANGKIDPQQYQIALASRSTIWRYYLINRQAQRPGGGAVVVDDRRDEASGVPPGIQFIKLDQTVAVDGVAATVFESQAPLPLLQTPGVALQFSYRAGSGELGAARDVPLPYPAPSALAADRDQPQRLRSDMYVYL